jgi:hypothetical protein
MKTLVIIALSCIAALAYAMVGAENEYYQRFMALPDNYRHSEGGPIYQGGEARREPEYLATRMQLVTKYAWAVPNSDAIKALKAHSPNGLVDFGAGSGYWAKLLHEAGVEVEAIDNWTDKKPDLWFPVTQGSYELLPQHKDKTLLLCWPPRAAEMAVRAVQLWGGDTLAYVGEPAPARGTADPAFFAELQKHWRLVETVTIPSWYNRNDDLFIYRKK